MANDEQVLSEAAERLLTEAQKDKRFRGREGAVRHMRELLLGAVETSNLSLADQSWFDGKKREHGIT